MSSELFPAFIKLDNRPCLVVGAGAIATSKIASLLRAGAHITVVAPQAKSEVAKLASAGNITWHQREFHTDDLREHFPRHRSHRQRLRESRCFCRGTNEGNPHQRGR